MPRTVLSSSFPCHPCLYLGPRSVRHQPNLTYLPTFLLLLHLPPLPQTLFLFHFLQAATASSQRRSESELLHTILHLYFSLHLEEHDSVASTIRFLFTLIALLRLYAYSTIPTSPPPTKSDEPRPPPAERLPAILSLLLSRPISCPTTNCCEHDSENLTFLTLANANLNQSTCDGN